MKVVSGRPSEKDYTSRIYFVGAVLAAATGAYILLSPPRGIDVEKASVVRPTPSHPAAVVGLKPPSAVRPAPKPQRPAASAPPPLQASSSVADAAPVSMEAAFSTAALMQKSFDAAAAPPGLSPSAKSFDMQTRQVSAPAGEPAGLVERQPAPKNPPPLRKEPRPRVEPLGRASPAHAGPVQKPPRSPEREGASDNDQLRTLVVPVPLPVPPVAPHVAAPAAPPVAAKPGVGQGAARVVAPVAAGSSPAPAAVATSEGSLSLPKPSSAKPPSAPRNPFADRPSAGVNSAPGPLAAEKPALAHPPFKPFVVLVSGERAWVRVSPERTVIIQQGQSVPGLGKFDGTKFNH
jgi:hypothetical protein